MSGIVLQVLLASCRALLTDVPRRSELLADVLLTGRAERRVEAWLVVSASIRDCIQEVICQITPCTMQLALRGALLCSLAAAVAAAAGQGTVLARDAEACPYSINPAAAALGLLCFCSSGRCGPDGVLERCGFGVSSPS